MKITKSQLKPALRTMDDVKKYFKEIEGYEFRPLRADGTKKSLDDALKEIAGIQIRDTANFVVSRRRFNWEVGSVENGGDPNKFYRPREGDVIHLPLSNSTFQIMKVEDETPFYQLKNLPTFRLSCELFEYADENFDTQISQIDNVETYAAYQYILTIRTAEQARATATASID